MTKLSFVIGEFISSGSLRNERANDIAIHEKVAGQLLYNCFIFNT